MAVSLLQPHFNSASVFCVEREGHMRDCVVNKDECHILQGDKAKRVTAGRAGSGV